MRLAGKWLSFPVMVSMGVHLYQLLKTFPFKKEILLHGVSPDIQGEQFNESLQFRLPLFIMLQCVSVPTPTRGQLDKAPICKYILGYGEAMGWAHCMRE